MRSNRVRVAGFAVLALVSACNKKTERSAASNVGIRDSSKAVVSESAGDVVIATPVSAYVVKAPANPGSISGMVTLATPLPALPPSSTGRDTSSCAPTINDQSVQQAKGGLGGVVVWLDGIREGKAPGYERRVELESNDCVLSPRTQAAMVGSAVNVLGHDKFRQHLRFIAGGETAARAVVLLAGGEQVIPTELPFKAPGMVTVLDADHAWTRAQLAVFDHPYFAVTTPNGAFSIEGVPPGKYALRTWHERTGPTSQEVELSAGGVAKIMVPLTAK